MMPQEEYLYGVHPVFEMLRARRPISRLYIARNREETEKIYTLARQQHVPICRVHPEEIHRMAGTTKHQGVLAIVPRQSDYDLEALLEIPAQRKEPPFFLLVDSVEDPRNLGAILRTAESAGIHGVFIPKRRAAGPSPIVSKASAGAMAHLPVARVTNLAQTMDRLKKEGIQTIGLDPQSSHLHWKHDFREPTALIVGGEGAGMHVKIRERCDVLVSLPMRGVIESLNVSVATGIVAYEVLRQRSNL